jgi:hypothetical protein
MRYLPEQLLQSQTTAGNCPSVQMPQQSVSPTGKKIYSSPLRFSKQLRYAVPFFDRFRIQRKKS